MAKNGWTATHYGECQLCGHEQKLPGGGLLSLHGYSVRWNSFMGTCPGSRELPYEQSCGLLEGEIKAQRAHISHLQNWAKEIAKPSFKNVFVQEYVPAISRYAGSSYVERELQPSEYEIVEKKYGDGWSQFSI